MSQIKKKYIANKAIDGSKILLLNNDALKALDSFGVEQSVMRFSATDALEFMSAPESASDPVSNNQLSRKVYVDTQVSSEQSAREAAVSSEQSRAESAESGLSGRLGTLEGGQSVVGSVSKSLKDSKDYTDAAITSLIGGAPGILDTLKEISDAMALDDGIAAALASTVASNLQESKDYTDSKFVESAGNVAADLATEVAARQSADSTEQSRAIGEESRIEGLVSQEVLDRQSAISSEQSARQSADSSESGRAIGEEERIESKLDLEISDRVAAVTAEQSARESAVSSEQSARVAADTAEQSAREAAVTAEQSARVAADLAEQEAREFSDNSLANRLDIVEGLDTVEGSISKAVLTERSRAEGAESELQSNINTEKSRVDAILSASDADKDSFAEIVALINSVDTENDSAFASYVLDSNSALASEIASRESADSSEQGRAQGEEARIEGLVSTEVSQRQSAVSLLDARVTNEVTSLQASIYNEQVDRESAIISEQTARESADTAEASARASAINTEQYDRAMAVATEQSRAEEAESGLDGRLDLIEAVAYRKSRFVISSGNISSGYVELPMEAVSGSEQVYVGPLYIHESDEYSLSVVGGKTRITFGASLQSDGETPLSVGDLMYVRYVK